MANSKFEYVKEFEPDDRLPPSNWIVVRIDGCHFHQFSVDHAFEKPNDENALNLMNACAVSMLEQFPDIVFAYGVSDEYSFVLKETSQFYQRRASKILSLTVSYFTAVYVMKWKEFFPHKDLKRPPFFDGRVLCYPRAKIIRDYLSWRQVDCHINNQYNTCFWMLVKSGKTEREAQEMLKGMLSKDKNELLFQQFGANYDKLPAMFRKGSCVYRDKVEETVKFDLTGNPVKRIRKKVVLGHFDIIGPNFWREHPEILEED
ncbi:tRNA(His) guanylyltransferase 1 [Ananas comosus]|uniref:tRNA(His) guanylyltransferase n=1 Tax=Ananas comosus TaxID=4615 RepID=A0A199VG55_ANACO|nr:tRNA(His) guanylyltransferase 1 [Ananas comosus]